MKRRNSSLLSLLCLLLMPGPPAHAFSYVLQQVTGDTTLTTPPGVMTVNDRFATLFTAPVPNPFEYVAPSVLSLGQLETDPLFVPTLDDNTTGTFASSLSVIHTRFGPGNGAGGFAGPVDTIEASARLIGTVGYGNGLPFSESHFNNGTLTILSGPNAGLVGTDSIDPKNGLPALLLTPVYGGVTASLWFDTISSIPAPGAGQLALSGFVEDVPEPGPQVFVVAAAGSWWLMRAWRVRNRHEDTHTT